MTEGGICPIRGDMEPLKLLISRVKAYAGKAGISETTASRLVFNDGKRLASLEKGSRLWPETQEKAETRLTELEAALTEAA